MVEKELLDAIKQKRDHGIQQDKISADLLGEGWEEGEIKEAMHVSGVMNPILIDDSVRPDTSSSKFMLHTERRGSSNSRIFLFILIPVLICGLLIALFFVFFVKSSPSTIKKDTTKIDTTDKSAVSKDTVSTPPLDVTPAPDSTTPADAVDTEIVVSKKSPWKLYSYPTEKFSANFLAVPHVSNLNYDTSVGTISVNRYESNLNGLELGLRHSVEYITPPETIFAVGDTPLVQDKKSLEFYKKLLSSIYTDVTFGSSISLSGHKVVSYVASERNKLYKGRFTSQNAKIYNYVGECLFCTDVISSREFLNSFKLLP